MYPPQITAVKLDEPSRTISSINLSSSQSSLSKNATSMRVPDASLDFNENRPQSKKNNSSKENSSKESQCSAKENAPAKANQASEAGKKRNRSNPPSQSSKHHHQSNHPANSSNDSQTNLNPFQTRNNSSFKPRPFNRRNYHYQNYDRYYDRHHDRAFDRHYDRDYQPNYRSKYEPHFGKPFNSSGYKPAYGKPHYGDREPFRSGHKSAEFERPNLQTVDLSALDEETLELVRNKQRLNKKLDERYEKEVQQALTGKQRLKEIHYYEKMRQIDRQLANSQKTQLSQIENQNDTDSHTSGHSSGYTQSNIENDMNQLNMNALSEQRNETSGVHRHQFKSQHSVDAHQLIRASVEHRSLEVHQHGLPVELQAKQENSLADGLSDGHLCSATRHSGTIDRPTDRSTDRSLERSLNRSQNSLNRSCNRSANGHSFNGNSFNGRSLANNPPFNSFHSQPFKANSLARPNKPLDRSASSSSPNNSLDKPTATSRPITKSNNPITHHKPGQLLINGFYAYTADLVPKILTCQQKLPIKREPISPNEHSMVAAASHQSQVLANGQPLNPGLANLQPINLANYPTNAIVHLNQSLEMQLNASLNRDELQSNLLAERTNTLNGSANSLNRSTSNRTGSTHSLKFTERSTNRPAHSDAVRKSKQQNADAFESVGDNERPFKKANDVPIRDKTGERPPPPNQSQASSLTNSANGLVERQSIGATTTQTTSISKAVTGKPPSSDKPDAEKNKKPANFQRDFSKERDRKDYVKSERDYPKPERDYKEKRPFLNEYKQRKNSKYNKHHPTAGAPRSTSTNYTSYGPSYPKLIQNDVLSSQIWKTYLLLRQTPESYQRKIELRQILYDVLRQQFENNLYIVGSSLNGLGTNTSDVDMCLLLPDRIGEIDQLSQAIPLLELVKNVIQDRPDLNFFDTESMKLIHAKIPILKFSDKRSKIEVDLNINNIVGIRNTQLIRCYTRLDWRVQPLAIAIKAWAHRNNIKNAYQKTISSYTLVLMLIHYLQVGCSPPCLPCLHKMMPNNFHADSDVKKLSLNEETPEYRSKNEQSLGELFVGFLDYYGNRFNYLQDVISIRQGAVLKKEVAKEYRSSKNTSTQWRFICCEEPFDRTNTARSVSDYDSYMRIIGVFKESYARLRDTQSLLSVLNLDHILSQSAYRTHSFNGQHSLNGITSEMISSHSSSDLTQQNSSPDNSSQNSSQGSGHTAVGRASPRGVV